MIAISVTSSHAFSEGRIATIKAPFYVGQTVMACGVVAQHSIGKKANYLNFDKPYPNQSLSALIWNDKTAGFEQRFGNLKSLVNQRVCVRGPITEYKNTLQIVVSNPQFLRLME